MNRRTTSIVVCVAALMLTATANAVAEYITVYGGPTYDQVTGTGLDEGTIPPGSGALDVNCGGEAVGYSHKFVSWEYKWTRPVRWDAAGNAMELPTLGTDSEGSTHGYARDIAESGLSVGYTSKYVGGSYRGNRAVLWDAQGNITELANLGLGSGGYTNTEANDTNEAGLIVGYASKYVSGVDLKDRAVVWDAQGKITELASLGTDYLGRAGGNAYDINEAGLIVGSVKKYVSGTDKGYLPVLWDAQGNITELDVIWANADGVAWGIARHVNEAGLSVGSVKKYVSGVFKGHRPILWDTAGNATELTLLGDPEASATAYVRAINDAGMSVGEQLYGPGLLWDASGNVTELSLGAPEDINNAGFIVGKARGDAGYYAICWRPDGSVIDLNDLIDPASGWLLKSARAISDTGWIAGSGYFDPDGAGPLEAYGRLYVLQIPEPATVSLLALGGLALVRRRWK